MSTLSQLQTRLAERLADTANAIWSTDALAEAIRAALAEYNEVLPAEHETVLTLPGAGREVALEGLTGLLDVAAVWWPFDSLAASEQWPPNAVTGFTVWWDDARPVLHLNSREGGQPQQDDELRLWYTAPQTIAGLDEADTTTLDSLGESRLLDGAAGYAAARQQIRRAGAVRIDPQEAETLRAWGEARLNEYRAWLQRQRQQRALRGPAWPAVGWPLDKWDTNPE